MTLLDRLILTLLGPVLVIGVLVQVSGCNTVPVETRLHNVDTGAANIVKSANDAKQHTAAITGTDNAPHKQAIAADLSSILIDAQGIHLNTAGALKADEAKQQQLDRYTNDRAVQFVVGVERWAKVLLWVLVVGTVLAVVLRVLSVGPLAGTGFGAVLAGAGSAICAVLPWVGHWIQFAADNVWMHLRQPAVAPATTTGATS